MIRRLFFVAICSVFFPSLASASINQFDDVRLTRGPGSSGGVFYVEDKTAAFAAPFSTFCVEIGEFVTIPGTYEVADISNVTADGGIYGPKNLTHEAAWLYIEFTKGANSFANALGTVDSLFNSPLIDNAAGDARANALQRAIWQAMGYTTGMPIGSTTLSSNLLAAATAAVIGGWENEATNPDGYVQIMNLETLAGGKAQDQLLILPPEPDDTGIVPEPTALVVWSLLAGCAGLVISRRSSALKK